MKNYFIYSTLIGLFTEAFRFRMGVDFKLIYLIVFINFFIIAFKNREILIARYWLPAIIYLFLSGVLSIFLYNNQFSSVAFQVFGVSFMSIYFYNFFLCYDIDVIDIFEKYCNIAFILSLIGIPIYFIIIIFDNDYRLHSILLEAAHFCGIMIPAYYYYLINYKRFKLRFFVILIALILSFSSIGYILMLLALIISKRKINFFVNGGLVLLALLLGFFAYTFIPGVKLRVDDTIGITQDFTVSTDVNSSTLAIASNFYVGYCAFISDPLIGRGIGSHPISYEKYIFNVAGIESYEDNDALLFLNATDAASLMLRILSELGLVGLFATMFFIFKYYTNKDDGYVISRAILLYFFYKLFREGHYFPPEMYFFVCTYYFLPLSLKRNKNVDRSDLASA